MANPSADLAHRPDSIEEAQGGEELTSRGLPDSESEFLLRVARGSEGAEPPRGLSGAEDVTWAEPRFELRRRLGAGGFGVVYEAFDRRRNARVALKRSARGAPEERHRFKQEFRALAGLDHPNLVRLYELHGDDAAWFFTMELVVGEDAMAHVRGTAGGFDEARVRAVFSQLAEGLRFLHEAGRLHRDVKPSNVMVDGDGRVVLLDFGLSVDLERDGDGTFGKAGTPSYMAPEQYTRGRIGAPADLYAMGVMLYEALVGRPPFEGSLADIEAAKRASEPPAPAAQVSGLPDDLSRLCVDLLKRAPELRPPDAEVCARLAAGARAAPSIDAQRARAIRPPPARSRRTPDFVGRVGELEQLREALALARGGSRALVLVHAGSGMGKTALVHRFLEEVSEREAGVIVLEGRCFEQESMPDKTLDGIVDALGRHLSRLPAAEAEALLPDDAAALSRVFPALGRVAALRAASRRAEAMDAIELRRRAVRALRELLLRLGERARLVLFIDDLQWGDAEGGALLADLVRPPDAPSMLVIGAYRTEEATRSECLLTLLPALGSKGDSPFDLREIALLGLTFAEALALARSTLGERAASLSEQVTRIARESDGSPFFLVELCRFSADGGVAEGAPIGGQPSLSAMLAARVAALPDDARRLLDVIAVAGQPIERSVAAKASSLGDGEPSAVGLLRARSFVRVRSGAPEDAIEASHDRVRDLVLARLAPAARRHHHRRLAEALVDAGSTDLEVLATHFQGADQVATAAGYWSGAADQALHALGFERAARLYRQAIAGVGGDRDQRRALEEKLGSALAHCGRGREAAVAYLAAAEGADAARGAETRRLAAEQYLLSGHLEEGFVVLRSVIEATGLSLPKTPVDALARGVALMAWIEIRGLHSRARPLDQIPADRLLRIDVWSAATQAATHVDPPRALYYHMRALLLALESGDPYRLLRELMLNLCFRATLRGEAEETRFEAAIGEKVSELLASLRGSGPRFQAARGLVEMGRGIVLAFRLQYRAAREHLERAEAELAACPLRLANDLTVTRVWLSTALLGQGEWAELARRHPAFLEDARARGDRFAEVQLSIVQCVLELSADRPIEAQRALDHLWSLLPPGSRRTGSVTFNPVIMRALYRDEGLGDAAFRERPTGLHLVTLELSTRMCASVRVYHLLSVGAIHLAAAATVVGARRSGLLREADAHAGTLARLGTPFARAAALALRAGAAAARGQRIHASALVAEAEDRFAAIDMAHYAAAARRRRGELLGGDEGSALITSADAALRARGVVNPARMAAALLPGRW